jgi:hypothetical protein
MTLEQLEVVLLDWSSSEECLPAIHYFLELYIVVLLY